MPNKNPHEIPLFVHTPDDDYIDAPISSKAFDEVIQWATKWSRSCDTGVVERARNVVKALELFLEALDQRCRNIDADSGGDPYFAGLLGQAEALIAAGSKKRRTRKTRS